MEIIKHHQSKDIYKMSKRELLTLDFEGILKYFRVSLPKKYRNEDVVRQVMKLATNTKVRRLKKYEQEYLSIKQQDMQQDPVIRLQKENQHLVHEKMRLERENDYLVNEYVQTKLKETIDKLEEKCDYLTKEVHSLNAALNEAEEEKRRLLLESVQVKELLKREVEKGDAEARKNSAIIFDYKQICSKLSSRLDKEQAMSVKAVSDYKAMVSSACENCRQLLSPSREISNINELEVVEEEKTLNCLVKDLEMELAKTKLALVEAECRNQDLTHKLGSYLNELQANKNTWLQKTITSISSLKERTGSTGSSTGGYSITPTSNAPVAIAVQPTRTTNTAMSSQSHNQIDPSIHDTLSDGTCEEVFIAQ